MKNYNAPKNQTTRRSLLIACATALAVAFTASLPQPGHADPVTPPAMPSHIQAPAGHKAFLEGHAVGTQQYICLFPGPSSPWQFFGPQATLFDDDDKQIITHFLSPNPFEPSSNPLEANGTPRPTWQDSKGTSTVWATLPPIASASNLDFPAFVAPGAIPWLLLRVAGAQDGPTGGDRLTATTFIQRLNTSGGVAPSTGCASSTDVGNQAFVPYTADYFFYSNKKDKN